MPFPRSLSSWLLPSALVLLAACLLLFTSHNRFPFFYHPDEPDKVEQVITGKWNFHHPLLMLAVTRIVAKAIHTVSDEQSIVILGRWISAAFAAIGVLSFALLGGLRRGAAGFLAVALLLGLNHQVFELAHYLKEDTALLMGLGLGFLALTLYGIRRDTPSLLLLALAVGLSVSAKYIGIVILIPAIIAVLSTPKNGSNRSSPLTLLLFLGGFITTFALANYPLFADLGTFKNSFHREIDLVRESSGRMPLLEYLKIFVSNTNLAIWVFLAIHLAKEWRNRAHLKPLEWTMTLFPFLFVAILSCSHKTNDRYFLPATALFTFMAGMGICDAAELLRINRRQAIAIGLAIAGLFQVVRVPLLNPHSLSEYYQAFQHDDRADLIAWIGSNLPKQAVIAQDNRVALPTPGRPSRLKVQGLLQQRIIDPKMLANLGPLNSLPAMGITHLIASESDYGKFYRGSWTARKPEEAQKKQFYEQLFKRAELKWERPRGTVIYLHPGLQLFELPRQCEAPSEPR